MNFLCPFQSTSPQVVSRECLVKATRTSGCAAGLSRAVRRRLPSARRRAIAWRSSAMPLRRRQRSRQALRPAAFEEPPSRPNGDYFIATPPKEWQSTPASRRSSGSLRYSDWTRRTPPATAREKAEKQAQRARKMRKSKVEQHAYLTLARREPPPASQDEGIVQLVSTLISKLPFLGEQASEPTSTKVLAQSKSPVWGRDRLQAPVTRSRDSPSSSIGTVSSISSESATGGRPVSRRMERGFDLMLEA
jgi:hypothetical protein